MSTTPLIDRIKRGNHPTVRHGVAGEPRTGCLVPHETAGGRIIRIGNRRPVWLRRLDEKVTSHKFTTTDIYVNGAWQSPKDGGAA